MSKPLSLMTRRHALLAIGSAASSVSLPSLAAPAPEGDIVIGQSLPMSGPAATVFEPLRIGQDFALKDINDRGGIHGRKLKLVQLDDAYDTKATAANVTRLIDEHKVVALFGLASTGGVAESLPILTQKRVPLIGAYTGSPALREKQHPYFFTLTASYRDEVVQMMRNQVTLHRSRIAVLFSNTVFGKLMVPVVEEVARAHNITIVSRASLEMNGSDAVAAADQLAKGEPQAVIMMSFGPGILPFIKAAKTRIGVQIYCPSIATSRQLNEALGDDARGLAYTEVLPYPFRTTTSVARDYNAAMTAAKLPIDYDHFSGYLNLRAFAGVLQAVGKQFSSQSLPASIQRIKRLDIGGHVLEFSPTNHHGSRFVETVVVGPGGRYLR